ncbi:DUF4169 family protein [Sphingoaurantiacus capsulatus]|uniref:DUF4169 family protein n=1 Tax=Sphingoaurantiacus capsulatus TaxID=1771310 RepID=A0ABV7X976_9SPHN
MADIVNLRAARKRKERETATATAAANRAQFGRTKAQKQASEMDAERLDRTLDGAKRDDG